MCMFIIPITLGYCRRFRLVSFRDNDVWADDDVSSKSGSVEQKSDQTLLSKNLPNHERQAALAARKLGEGVLDGMEAVTLGLAKRGVVKTYVMIEGCPKELGCTVVLRGASRPALKQVKRVLRFLINCSYNMKLETSYILERCCRLPSSYEIPSTPCCSSSLCVDFGKPPNNRKARPWNGGEERSSTAFTFRKDHTLGPPSHPHHECMDDGQDSVLPSRSERHLLLLYARCITWPIPPRFLLQSIIEMPESIL